MKRSASIHLKFRLILWWRRYFVTAAHAACPKAYDYFEICRASEHGFSCWYRSWALSGSCFASCLSANWSSLPPSKYQQSWTQNLEPDFSLVTKTRNFSSIKCCSSILLETFFSIVPSTKKPLVLCIPYSIYFYNWIWFNNIYQS